MKKEDKLNILDDIDNESFEYIFLHKSNFEHINDTTFHELRKHYIEAHKKLLKFLKSK